MDVGFEGVLKDHGGIKRVACWNCKVCDGGGKSNSAGYSSVLSYSFVEVEYLSGKEALVDCDLLAHSENECLNCRIIKELV